MELGEVTCVPRAPRCGECPAEKWCEARARKLTEQIPAPRRKRAPVRMYIAAAILCDGQQRTLLVRDPGAHDDVLFSRMWQFPAVEVKTDPSAELRTYLRETLCIDVELEALPAASHGVTFRNITLLPFIARVKTLPRCPRSRVLFLRDLHELPVSSATRKIATALDYQVSDS